MKKTMGLYDSDTGKSIETLKEVDITDFCEPTDYFAGDRVWLVYGNSKRGIICKLEGRNSEGRPTMGIHWFVNEPDREMNQPKMNDTFGSMAKRLGITKIALKKMIEGNQP